MPPKTKLCLLIAQQCRTLYTLTFFHCTNSSILFTNGHVFSSSKTAWISKSRERVRAQIITTFLLQMGNRLVKERGCVGGVGQQVTLQVQYRGTNHHLPSPPPPSPPHHHLNLQHNPYYYDCQHAWSSGMLAEDYAEIVDEEGDYSSPARDYELDRARIELSEIIGEVTTQIFGLKYFSLWGVARIS